MILLWHVHGDKTLEGLDGGWRVAQAQVKSTLQPSMRLETRSMSYRSEESLKDTSSLGMPTGGMDQLSPGPWMPFRNHQEILSSSGPHWTFPPSPKAAVWQGYRISTSFCFWGNRHFKCGTMVIVAAATFENLTQKLWMVLWEFSQSAFPLPFA